MEKNKQVFAFTATVSEPGETYVRFAQAFETEGGITIAVRGGDGVTNTVEMPVDQAKVLSRALAGSEDDLVKRMVNRFLTWRLPETFNPDGGVSFVRPNYAPEVDGRPSGTNLFDAAQAEAMVRYMLGDDAS